MMGEKTLNLILKAASELQTCQCVNTFVNYDLAEFLPLV